ncbi:MAG: hypothetical protein IKX88_06410 [Thermoguttaceae bacterium]|nr:hypothetical protein [Thermoguttaceae bacterium]
MYRRRPCYYESNFTYLPAIPYYSDNAYDYYGSTRLKRRSGLRRWFGFTIKAIFVVAVCAHIIPQRARDVVNTYAANQYRAIVDSFSQRTDERRIQELKTLKASLASTEEQLKQAVVLEERNQNNAKIIAVSLANDEPTVVVNHFEHNREDATRELGRLDSEIGSQQSKILELTSKKNELEAKIAALENKGVKTISDNEETTRAGALTDDELILKYAKQKETRFF